MNNNYKNILWKLALKAAKKNEVPISAIIVYNNKIIAKAYNKKNIKNNPILHAEIICLYKAYKKLNTWNLSNCVMYVTLEPCDMCKIIISESRIDKVYFILKKGGKGNKFQKTQYEQMYVSECYQFEKLLKNFFKKLRK